MRICVYHPTMGRAIERAVLAAFPQARVDLVHDVRTDPPQAGEIEVLVANTFPPRLLERLPRLRWLHLTGSGTDHLPGGKPRPDLVVTTSASVPARAVAEFAWMGVLALAKDAVRLTEQQRDGIWRLPDARLVAGSSLLLVGLGRIGREIATRARAFDVHVTAVTRSAEPQPAADMVLPVGMLAEAASQADHLVVAVPGNPRTRHLVDGQVIASLPQHATLVNVARASVVDLDALVTALHAGRLRGALLDVHHEEPLPAGSPMWTVPNLWVTPHGAYRFPEEEEHVARLVVANLRALQGSGRLIDQVWPLAPAAGAPSRQH